MKKLIPAALVVAFALGAPAPALADKADCSPKLEKAYSGNWHAVAKKAKAGKLRKEAQGRNIRKKGVIYKRVVFDATCPELSRSNRQLKRLLIVARAYRSTPTAVVKSTPPAQPPAGVHSATTASNGGSSNSYVNPSCESGGNSQVYDPSGTYWGKYQFDRQTWIAHGGSGSSYGNASEIEQDRVAANVTYDAWPNC